MTRIGAVLLILTGVALGLPGSAQAKGMELDGVVLEGPGLAGPLELSRKEFGIPQSENSPAAEAVGALFDPHTDITPTGSLGPRYELTYEMNIGFAPDIRKLSVRVGLYPFAESGPVAFIPTGQASPWPLGQGSIQVLSGWHDYPRALIRNFVRHGLPNEAAPQPAATSLPWAWLIAGMLLIAFAQPLGVFGRVSKNAHYLSLFAHSAVRRGVDQNWRS